MSATKDDINAAVTMTQSSRQIKFQERMKVKKQAKMQSNFRKFVKQRIERRKAGGGNEANSDRGLASLNFVNHSMPQNQHQKLLQKVLLSDLPIGYHNKEGINALHVASSRSNIKIINKLINSGSISKVKIKPKQRAHKINPRKKTRDGMSALHFVASADKDDIVTCELILNLMLDTFHVYDGTSSHMFDARNLNYVNLPDVSTSRERLICELLLQKTNKVGINVLGVCCLSSNSLVMEYLLNQFEPSVFYNQENVTSNESTTVPSIDTINYSANESNSIQNVNRHVNPVGLYILEQNITSRGHSYYHIACNNCDYKMLKLFERMGATFDFKTDLDGRSPMHHLAMTTRAASNSHKIVYDFIKSKYLLQCRSSPINNKDKDMIRKMLNLTNNKGETPLHLACKTGAAALARMIWVDGGNLLFKNKDNVGNNPFINLLKHRYKNKKILLLIRDIIKQLPHSWFDHSLHRKTGKSALIIACEWRNVEALEIMLQSLPSNNCLHYVDIYCKTPMHYCSEMNFLEGLELLLQYDNQLINKSSSNANTSVLELQDHEGCTPLMLAIGSNDSIAVDMVLKAVVLLDCQNLKRQKEKDNENAENAENVENAENAENDTTPIQVMMDDNGIPLDASSSSPPYLHLTNQLMKYQNNDGLSPLQISALLPTANIINILLEASKVCNCSQYITSSMTKEENNILHCSAAGGSIETILALASFNFDLTVHLTRQRNCKGKRPSDLAKYWKHHEVCKLLLNLEHDNSH
jgi:ankyrin repeat protein